jgi:metal-responsive CopG/Arc/MetJ family transcriptional regulator
METKMLTVRVPGRLIEELDALAEANRLNRADLVRDVLERAVQKGKRSAKSERSLRFAGDPP